MRLLIVTVLLISVLSSGCTPTPIYKEPMDLDHSARVSLSLSDESLISGIAIVGIVDGTIVCGEPLPNYRKMLVISKGNPLVKDLNRNGARVPAGQSITLSVSGLNDGFKGCGRLVSFTPKSGGNYEIGMANKTMRIPFPFANKVIECPIVIAETSQDEHGKAVYTEVDLTYVSCQEKRH
jgi:hypothetical protein